MKTKIFGICLVMAMIFAFVGCTDVNQAVIDEALAIQEAKKPVDIVISGATVTASGLPAELNGTTLYFTGDFNGWATPGDAASIEATVANGEISVNLPDLSATVPGDNRVISVQGKFANTGWSKPEICAESGNISLSFSPDKKAAVGTYKSVADNVYVCDWVVE